jgi:ADP-ribose pyrophosphatase
MATDHDAVPYVFTGSSVEYQDPYLTIRRHVGVTSDGSPVTFHLREEGAVAVCLPVLADGTIVTVREFRPGPNRYLMEVPGGMVDEGEDPMAAAAREVLEETGYVGEIEPLGASWVSAYSNQRKYMYLMRNARKVAEPQLEPSEISEVVLLDRPAFEAVLAAGELTDLDAGLLALQALEA